MATLKEENGVYCMDCSNAIWATDEVHDKYKAAGGSLSDVDFIIETKERLLLVEYKNDSIAGAACPEAFVPESNKKINSVVKKFYDTLHYLNLLGKNKPKEYIYILEYPHGDATSRRFIRNKLVPKLPFKLQEDMPHEVRLIEKIEVMSIAEWNESAEYGGYPIKAISE